MAIIRSHAAIRHRAAFSLVEVVSALTASALLLLALASSVAIAVSVVEPDESRQQRWRDRSIVDRLSGDLRYATAVDSNTSGIVSLSRPDSLGQIEQFQYSTGLDGLTRQLIGQSAVTLDEETPIMSHLVDGYSAPTSASTPLRPRLRDQSTAVTDDSDPDTLDIAVPDGARNGDLLLLVVAYQTSDALTTLQAGWMTGSSASNSEISIVSWWRIMDGTTALNQTIQLTAGDQVSVALLAIEHPDLNAPIGWYGYRIGVASLEDSTSYPGVVDIQTGTEPESLVVQCIAMTSGWASDDTLGVTAFTDGARAIAAPLSASPTALGVICRTGPLPSMTTVPRVDPLQSSSWVNLAIEVEGANE